MLKRHKLLTLLQNVFIECLLEGLVGIQEGQQIPLLSAVDILDLEGLQRGGKAALEDVLGRQVLLHVIHACRLCEWKNTNQRGEFDMFNVTLISIHYIYLTFTKYC